MKKLIFFGLYILLSYSSFAQTYPSIRVSKFIIQDSVVTAIYSGVLVNDDYVHQEIKNFRDTLTFPDSSWYSIDVNHINFDTLDGTSLPQRTGQLYWNSAEGKKTLTVDLGGGSHLDLGQEQNLPVQNNTGFLIPNGKIVYLIPHTSAVYRIGLADKDNYLAYYAIGMTTTDIPQGGEGRVCTFGDVSDLNTAGHEGQLIWLGDDGDYQYTMPTTGARIAMGFVKQGHSSEGIIFIYRTLHSIRDFAVLNNNGTDGTYLDSSYVDTDTLKSQVIGLNGDYIDSWSDVGGNPVLANVTASDTLRWATDTSNFALIADSALRIGVQSYIDFDTTITEPGNITGRLFWDETHKTISIHDGGNSTTQLGQEINIYVQNLSGENIHEGTPVYIVPYNAHEIRVTTASNLNRNAYGTLGLATTDIPNGGSGRVCAYGAVHNLNTNSYTEGDTIFLADGSLTNVKPIIGHVIKIGQVTRKHLNEGVIWVDKHYLTSMNYAVLNHNGTTGTYIDSTSIQTDTIKTTFIWINDSTYIDSDGSINYTGETFFNGMYGTTNNGAEGAMYTYTSDNGDTAFINLYTLDADAQQMSILIDRSGIYYDESTVPDTFGENHLITKGYLAGLLELDSIPVEGATDSVNLDMQSEVEKVFFTSELDANTTVFLSNNENMRTLSYNVRVTGTVILTFGGMLNWLCDDPDWDNSNKQYTLTGTSLAHYEISILKVTFDGVDYYKIKFSGEQI